MPIKGTRLAHDAQQGGAHKVPPFFWTAPRVCDVFGRARGTVVDPESGYSVSSGKQKNWRTPKAHGCFMSSCAFLLIRAMPVHVDITVGSVDSNRYNRCRACMAERTLRDSVSHCI